MWWEGLSPHNDPWGDGRRSGLASGCRPCTSPSPVCAFNLWQWARVSLAALSSPSLDKRHFIRAKARQGEALSEVTWPFRSETERPDACTLLSLWDYSLAVKSGSDQTALSTYRACGECRFVLIHSNGLCSIRFTLQPCVHPFTLTPWDQLTMQLWEQFLARGQTYQVDCVEPTTLISPWQRLSRSWKHQDKYLLWHITNVYLTEQTYDEWN